MEPADTCQYMTRSEGSIGLPFSSELWGGSHLLRTKLGLTRDKQLLPKKADGVLVVMGVIRQKVGL